MRTLLESMPDIVVAGEATTGAEAVEQALALKPDLVLMDLQMPEGGGLEATRRITEADPQIHILVVTLFEDDDSVFAALRAGGIPVRFVTNTTRVPCATTVLRPLRTAIAPVRSASSRAAVRRASSSAGTSRPSKRAASPGCGVSTRG